MLFTAFIPTVIKLLEATMFLYFRLPVDVHTPAVISGGLRELHCLYSYCTFLSHFCSYFYPAGLDVFLVDVGSQFSLSSHSCPSRVTTSVFITLTMNLIR